MRGLVLAAVLLASCSERALEVGAGTSAIFDAATTTCGDQRLCTESATKMKFTLPDVCVSSDGDLEITGKPVGLRFCHCLHGCGPGIDGAIELTIANHGLSARALALADVYYTGTGPAQEIYEDASAQPGLRRMYTCAGEGAAWDGRVASGETELIVVPQHFDVTAPGQGDYHVRVQLSVDGALRWFELGTMTLAEDTSCH